MKTDKKKKVTQIKRDTYGVDVKTIQEIGKSAKEFNKYQREMGYAK